MITLHRLGHSNEPFQLNVDMVVTVESTPDTVITLATGTKVVVVETPAEVAAAMHDYRADVLAAAFKRRGRPSGSAPQPQPAPPVTGIHRGPARLSAVASISSSSSHRPGAGKMDDDAPPEEEDDAG